ncbi:molybdenum cofactor synthesis domain-containing protein [Sporobacter termitidis DSM 10068]|uniref:Molybdopterin molybdenumtransferase n=1 Tax=Sporobacter termitidis DSM 10068 TaxID=1123282 RepID=A0A1M5VRX3_9FIRM|nr:molybdopterin-binding protein [Sporobacter termitidis]SHH78021.1 molybdenum cofactor synthesis domain-containing protein [Sporobacter termitidis DSM 10068]
MRKIKVEDAVGEMLCHDMTGVNDNGVKCVRFKRGHVITEADIPALLNIGKGHIFVWEPDADEVHEDDAAIALAEVICGDNLSYDKKPSEGKIQINAAADGLFTVNREALRKINSVGDYTVATLPNFTRVDKGQKLCGLRIVPLVTKRDNVDRAVALARENFPVITVLPFKPLKCGVIITGSEVYYGRIQDRFEPVMTKKLAGYGAQLLGFTKCPDDLAMIGAAIQDFLKKGAEVILLTGGMSVDPDDLTPTAIRQSGAEIITQGVPMQPGNMLTMAYLEETILIGVPGASMNFPTTSLEVFLPRIFAGLKITKEEIAGYGEGGFCLMCAECRYPNCYFGHSV